MARQIEKIFVFACIIFFSARFAGATDRITVFVSILPQKTVVQQIGADRVDVRVMVAPGASPATYEPKPQQMAALSGARIYFAIGVPFEDVWLKRIAAANPRMKVVHTDRGIEKLPMATPPPHGAPPDRPRAGNPAAHHGHDVHGTADPHIWLAPPLVKDQARTIMAALQEIDPGHGDGYQANYRTLAAAIDVLDADLKRIFAGRQGLCFMVFHPSWGYFARAYGLVQVPVEIEGKTPKPAQLMALIEHARADGIRVVFVQPQFSSRNAELIAREIGGQVALADPLAENWMANLRQVADKFKAALR